MLDRELTVARQAAREAGAAILHIAEVHYQEAAAQADRTVVTKADVEADRILQRHLRQGFPDDGWLCEESKDDESRLGRHRVWIIDPMDGTREFVMKVPEFVVSIALAEKGVPILTPAISFLLHGIQKRLMRIEITGTLKEPDFKLSTWRMITGPIESLYEVIKSPFGGKKEPEPEKPKGEKVRRPMESFSY